MPVSLAFDAAQHFTDALDGIEVPITLCIGRQSVELLAKLETGAAHCMFERKYAEMLGVDADRLQRFRTGLGRLLPIDARSPFRRLGLSFQQSSSLPGTPHLTGTSLAVPVGWNAFA